MQQRQDTRPTRELNGNKHLSYWLTSGADWPSGVPGVSPVGRCSAWAGRIKKKSYRPTFVYQIVSLSHISDITIPTTPFPFHQQCCQMGGFPAQLGWFGLGCIWLVKLGLGWWTEFGLVSMSWAGSEKHHWYYVSVLQSTKLSQTYYIWYLSGPFLYSYVQCRQLNWP